MMGRLMMRNRYIALIPAYEPDEKIKGLADELPEKGFDIVIVDDGSGPDTVVRTGSGRERECVGRRG